VDGYAKKVVEFIGGGEANIDTLPENIEAMRRAF